MCIHYEKDSQEGGKGYRVAYHCMVRRVYQNIFGVWLIRVTWNFFLKLMN